MPLWCYGHLSEKKCVIKSPASFGVTTCLQAGCERYAAYTSEGRRGPPPGSAPYPTGKTRVTAVTAFTVTAVTPPSMVRGSGLPSARCRLCDWRGGTRRAIPAQSTGTGQDSQASRRGGSQPRCPRSAARAGPTWPRERFRYKACRSAGSRTAWSMNQE
jgi:hypothetical protein